jgi:hypothetical protein
MRFSFSCWINFEWSNYFQIIEVDDLKFSVSISLYFVVQWFEPRLLGRDGNRLSLNSSRDSASQVLAHFVYRKGSLYSHLMALICIWNFYYCQTVRLFKFLHVRKCLSKNFDNDFQSIWINFLSCFPGLLPSGHEIR